MSSTNGLATLRGMAFGIVAVCMTASIANSQVLLQDDFNGAGFIDQLNWRLPAGGDGSFLGRTQLKTNLETEYPIQSGGVATLELDTFLDDGTGNSAGVFHGHEINSKRNFTRAGGLRIESRMRMRDVPEGLVGAFFMFDVQRTNAAGDLVRDEFDHELLTNEAQPGGQNRLLTNYWNDGPFVGPGAGGSGQLADPGIAGWDMTQFHDYRIDWLPNRLDYYVDGQLVRTATSDIPDDPMTLRFNLWAPADDFTTAYSAALQPAASMAQNQTFGLEIDDVLVTRLNTTASANMLANDSFEDLFGFQTFPLPSGVSESDTGSWFLFNNAFGQDPEVFRTGEFALKTFGPFTGEPNASGAWQNVDVTPGDELEARVFTQSISGDSIAGTQNFGTIKLEFLDSSGTVIPDNVKESVIFDGRDPDFPEDVWIEGTVNAIVPANAAKARVLLPFIQLNNEGGAVWWDDASLVVLTPDMTTVDGDFNDDTAYDCADVDALVAEIAGGTNDPAFDLTNDGVVNGDDLAAWLVEGGANNPGATGGNPFLVGDATLDGVVDGLDFIEWNDNKFTSTPAWCSGDFTADGVVDGLDFIAWNGNKFTSSDAVSSVPEPASISLLLLAALFGLNSRRNRR